MNQNNQEQNSAEHMDAQFLRNLPQSKAKALEIVIENFHKLNAMTSPSFGQLLMHYRAANSLCKEIELYRFVDKKPLEAKNGTREEIAFFFDVMGAYFAEYLIEERYSGFAKESFPDYQVTLSDEDIKLVQKKINELRDLVSDSKFLTDNHKKRLLLRLEKMQAELHKEMSSFDTFLGGVGDAGIALARFGKDVKPLVDRFREIGRILTRNTQGLNKIESKEFRNLLENNEDQNGN